MIATGFCARTVIMRFSFWERRGLVEIQRMNGRNVIYTDVTEIHAGNIKDVVEKAMTEHEFNRGEADYLYQYYKGNQPILDRKKDVRPEICNKIVINVANEIVSFKTGYLCGEPVQYVNRTTDEEKSKSINRLNDLMVDVSKVNEDQKLVEWQMITGTAYRMVLPKRDEDDDGLDCPFKLYTLDPRKTFVVYSSRVGNKPMVAVHYYKDESEKITYCCYTENRYYEWTDMEDVKEEPHALDMIPIIEYPANNARLGSFETVLTILDAINNIESNRMDGIEQFVQAFMKFINCDIDEPTWQKFREQGMIKIKTHDGQKADVDMVSNELDQTQTQTLRDDLYTAVLTICGMPNRNKNSGRFSSSDTGIAVELRDGWSAAETRAKDSENIFKVSERRMLRLVTKICRDIAGIELIASDIEIKFTRRNFEGIQAKSQVLVTMLERPQIHPLLAFTSCGLFSDPETAYQMSEKHYEEYQQKQLEKQMAEAEINAQYSGSGEVDITDNGGKTEADDSTTTGGKSADMVNAKNRQVKSYIRNGKRVRAYQR